MFAATPDRYEIICESPHDLECFLPQLNVASAIISLGSEFYEYRIDIDTRRVCSFCSSGNVDNKGFNLVETTKYIYVVSVCEHQD